MAMEKYEGDGVTDSKQREELYPLFPQDVQSPGTGAVIRLWMAAL
jgi:hypothetical protein